MEFAEIEELWNKILETIKDNIYFKKTIMILTDWG
ncbi:hypothetical protein ES708_27332 [subsurface metagenome]